MSPGIIFFLMFLVFIIGYAMRETLDDYGKFGTVMYYIFVPLSYLIQWTVYLVGILFVITWIAYSERE